VNSEEQTVGQAELELRQQGSSRVAGSIQTFLKLHAPFDKMSPEALQLFADKAQLVFHPAGSVILGPDSGKVQFFYLIESGKVQARQAGEVAVTEHSIMSLGPGESFPIGAVTAGRATTNTFTAVVDSFCYQLPAEDFMTLMATCREFNLFCTRHIASLLQQSRQELQQQFSQRASEQQTLNSQLANIGSRSPISVVPEMPLREALQCMSDKNVGSLVIAGKTASRSASSPAPTCSTASCWPICRRRCRSARRCHRTPSSWKSRRRPTMRCWRWRRTASATFWSPMPKAN